MVLSYTDAGFFATRDDADFACFVANLQPFLCKKVGNVRVCCKFATCSLCSIFPKERNVSVNREYPVFLLG